MQNYHLHKEHVPHRDIKILNTRNINFEKNAELLGGSKVSSYEPLIMSLENPNMTQIATDEEGNAGQGGSAVNI